MTLSHLEMSTILREELKATLQGPGITWNMKGVLNAFDRALVKTAFRTAEIELSTKE